MNLGWRWEIGVVRLSGAKSMGSPSPVPRIRRIIIHEIIDAHFSSGLFCFRSFDLDTARLRWGRQFGLIIDVLILLEQFEFGTFSAPGFLVWSRWGVRHGGSFGNAGRNVP